MTQQPDDYTPRQRSNVPPNQPYDPTQPYAPQQPGSFTEGFVRGMQGPQGWYEPYQRPQLPKKSHKVRNVLLGVIGGFIALIVIAAVASGGKQPTGSTAATTPGTAAAAPATQAAPSTHAAVPSKTVVLTKSGEGQVTTRKFTVADDWSLTYSFDCSNDLGGEGNFIVYEDYPNGMAIVNALNTKGSDVTYQTGDAGTHTLLVSSECNWTIKVTSGDDGQ